MDVRPVLGGYASDPMDGYSRFDAYPTNIRVRDSQKTAEPLLPQPRREQKRGDEAENAGPGRKEANAWVGFFAAGLFVSGA